MENMLPDIPRYYTALAEWLSCMVMILTIRHRMDGKKLAAFSAAVLIIQVLFLMLTDEVSSALWLPCMAIALGIMVGCIYCCSRVTLCGAMYLGLFGFIMAEFTASLEWQVYCYYVLKEPNPVLCLILFYGVSYFIFWKLLKAHVPEDETFNVQKGELAVSFFITAIAFALGNISFAYIHTPFTAFNGTEAATLRTMANLSGLGMMYARYIERQEIYVSRELSVMQSILENQYQQYQLSEESVNLLNYKYHDLKHQLEVLRSEENPEKRNTFLNQMEEDIRQYEAQNKTGNKVLDTLLTSKGMICEKKHISLNCVADGSLLEFIDLVDLSGIIGNALDNAIEYEQTVPDLEKRLIDIRIFAQNNFLIMHFANYFEGKLKKDGNTLLTTKGDSGFRGYGVKSIRYTVKKYDGAVSIDTKDNWFELKILIPMPM